MEQEMAETGYQLKGNATQQYERDIVPTLSKPQTEVMFEHVSLHEGERVLDIACGTGIVLRLAVERFRNIKSIVGVDINRGMLDVAKELTPTTDIPIEWRESDVCDLPFPDNSFEVVLCSQGVQFFPEKRAALHDVQRVLVSGGRLIFTVWSKHG
jgi:ubiquinone/menaquinone biosynthesis C-methylase UbiE